MPFEVTRRILRHLYGTLPHGVRLGAAYRRTRDLLRDSEWWSPDETRSYQCRELATLVRHAYENVPYYRRIFDERGLTPDAIRSPEDLHLGGSVPRFHATTGQQQPADTKDQASQTQVLCS